MKRKLFLIILIIQAAASRSQECGLQASLLTCTPGDELYATFGHTAVRMRDTANGMDLVFNYGTFEFGPDFYHQFVLGKLQYYLSVEDFDDFREQYRENRRGITEQLLDLSCTEKQNLMAALMMNASEEHRYYLYDFLYDNCTTRAGDIITAHIIKPMRFGNVLDDRELSFRNLIHEYLVAGRKYWSRLGIDMLLGVKVDRKVSNREAMFLPDYLMKGFDSAQIAGEPLVQSKQSVLMVKKNPDSFGFLRPSLLFSVILVLVVALSLSKAPPAHRALMIFDRIFFLLSGLAGFLMLFMWFGTDHHVCRNNFNLLWALPTHAVVALVPRWDRKWIRSYFRIVFWAGIVLFLGWFFLPQQMNQALIPVLILIIFRSWRKMKNHGNTGEKIQFR